MELVRGGTSEWYWATDYVHGDLYEAEELFRQKNSVQSNRLYLIHYPDGMVYEPVLPVDGQYLGYPVFDGESVVLLVVNFTESAIHILRFLHQQEKTQEVVRLPLSAVKDCYNLILHPSPLSLTRQPMMVHLRSSGLSRYVSQSVVEKHLISATETSSTSVFGMRILTIGKKH